MWCVTYDIFCEKCPQWIGEGWRSKNEAAQKARKAGWLITPRKHLCPDCRKEYMYE